jgi:hypothetical protein
MHRRNVLKAAATLPIFAAGFAPAQAATPDWTV